MKREVDGLKCAQGNAHRINRRVRDVRLRLVRGIESNNEPTSDSSTRIHRLCYFLFFSIYVASVGLLIRLASPISRADAVS